MSERIPAALEVSALIRQVQNAGGFATVIAKGHAEAGTILVVVAAHGWPQRAYERMPQIDGTRRWTLARTGDADNPRMLSEWLDRRAAQDSDLWIVELDIVQGERFIGLPPPPG